MPHININYYFLQVRTSVSVAEWQTVFVSSTSEESRRYRENENNVAFFLEHVYLLSLSEQVDVANSTKIRQDSI